MIHVGSYLKLMDNSGAKELQCIRIFSPSQKKPGKVGDRVLVSVKSATPKQRLTIQPGKIYEALIVHSKKEINRKDGSKVSSGANIAILLNSNGTPFCTRFFACLFYETRAQGVLKILSTAKYLY
jgi:large subunit ribosomal protein L14